MVCRKPGRLASILVLAVVSAPLGRSAHAQPPEAAQAPEAAPSEAAPPSEPTPPSSAAPAPALPEAWADDPIPPAPPRATDDERAPRASTRDILREDSSLGQRYRDARAMAVGGGVTMGVGFGFVVSAGAVALFEAPWQRTNFAGDPVDYDENQEERVAVVAFATVGAIAAVAGAAFLAVGVIRKQQAVERAQRISFDIRRGGLALRF